MNTKPAATARTLVASSLLVGLLAGLGAAAPDGSPSVRVEPLRGAAYAGALLSMGPEKVVVETATDRRSEPLGRVRSISFNRPASPTLADQAHLRIVLTTDEVLVGTVAGTTPDGLVLNAPGVGAIPLLFDVMRSIVPVPPDAGSCHEPERHHPTGEDDVAQAASGDEYAGILLEAKKDGLVIETRRGQTRTIAWPDLVVMHLSNPAAPVPKGVVVEVETVDGARLTTEAPIVLARGRMRITLRSRPDAPIELAVEQVRVVRVQGGDFTYASDLAFESEFVPYYREDPTSVAFHKRWWAARADRRPTGCPLRLDGVTYRHGFAVQARSTVRIPLAGAYSTFQTLFGVDDEVLERNVGGVVDARVLGDGKVLWSARDVRAGAPPRRIGPLDVSAVDVLVLEVDFGAELQVLDRATWADPILVRR